MLTAHQWLVFVFFVIGYLCIIFEHVIGIHKTTSAILTAAVCWIVHFLGPVPYSQDLAQFSVSLSDTSAIVFFLLGALAIVETIHEHGALNLVCHIIRVRTKKGMLWVVAFVTFFLSAILDNLTTTVVMVVLLRRLLYEREERLIFGSAVVIAANAGGAWTPMGDVTTTMLWVQEKLSASVLMGSLLLPSLACLLVSVLYISRYVRGDMAPERVKVSALIQPAARPILIFGMFALAAVPLAKCMTGLPPFLGMLTALAFVWLLTDYFHASDPNRQKLRMPAILPRIDIVSLLFFLGILLSVTVLRIAGILRVLAQQIDAILPVKEWVAVAIGIFSSIVDNVPLVAAAMNMYDAAAYPMDSSFWRLVAYCAGTGGSILIIGSAAGIAFMGLERVNFFWYVRRAAVPALLGYFAGVGVYALQLYCV